MWFGLACALFCLHSNLIIFKQTTPLTHLKKIKNWDIRKYRVLYSTYRVLFSFCRHTLIWWCGDSKTSQCVPPPPFFCCCWCKALFWRCVIQTLDHIQGIYLEQWNANTGTRSWENLRNPEADAASCDRHTSNMSDSSATPPNPSSSQLIRFYNYTPLTPSLPAILLHVVIFKSHRMFWSMIIYPLNYQMKE